MCGTSSSTADWQKYHLLIDLCAVSFTVCVFSCVNSKSLNEGFVNVWKHVCRFNYLLSFKTGRGRVYNR